MATVNNTRIPTPKARQRAFRSALRDVAVAVTMLEKANPELERDKTPIDQTAERNLQAVASRLYDLHKDGRFEGIDHGDERTSKGVANLLVRAAGGVA